MPANITLANEVWARYQFLRDNGHLDYVAKATTCENFFVGLQWEKNDLALLKSYRRPALTINKIISTISAVLGEQIFNRTDIAFKPRNEGATSEIADALTKVFMQIGDNNQLAWIRSDVFCDGIVTGRGFFDARLDFTDSLRGEVRIEQLNPKNVLIDADADEYDPDKWSDVLVTKWMSADQIELMYSKADAEILRGKPDSSFAHGYDAIDSERDRFGLSRAATYSSLMGSDNRALRNIRVIERQWKKLSSVHHFVDIETGDMRQVPGDWTPEQVQAYLQTKPNLSLTKKMIQRIRWTVVADNIVLHDDWSPYSHFTVIPYFPYFRRGTTVGLVENLIGPQELLNKVSSQELHVVNTSANSGWKVKTNALKNMSVGELENRGAQTGLVLELDEIDNAEKITPNSTPTGLDRISYKAEEHIKGISGVSDAMQGFSREDVAAKAIQTNKQSGQGNLAKVMDNMNRSDHILARNILDMVQEFYTEQRLLFITTDRLTNATEQMTVNQATPEGEIANDLTVGEYAVVVTNQPERDTFEETQFDQAIRLRTEAGVQIPDKFILEASRLKNKAEIIKAMEGDTESPEAQQAAALQQRGLEAEVAKLENEAADKQASAELKSTQAMKELEGEPGAAEQIQMEREKMQAELQLKREEMDAELAMEREKMEVEFQFKVREAQLDAQIKQQQSRADVMLKRAQAVQAAKNPAPSAGKPTPTGAKK